MIFATSALSAEALQKGQATAPTAARVASLELEEWVQSGWCWAAVTTMVHRAITGEHRPQCHWAERMLHQTCCAQAHTCRVLQPVKEVLDLEGHCREVLIGGPTFERVQQEIPVTGGGFPIVATQPGHTLVLFGWEIDPDEGPCVYWADPAEPDEKWEIFDPERARGANWECTFFTK